MCAPQRFERRSRQALRIGLARLGPSRYSLRMEWLILVAAVVAALGYWKTRSSGPRQLGPGAAVQWRPAVEEAALSLSGRPAYAGTTAQLRAEHEGLTVTLKIEGDELQGEAPQYPGSAPLRVFLGASGATAPSDFLHVPELELPPAFSLDPPTSLRSDEPARALAFVDDAARELVTAVRDARGTSVSVLCRGGTVRLTVRGAKPSTRAVESALRCTARLSTLLGGDRARAEASLAQLPAPAPRAVTCALCGGERRPGVAWVSCRRCGAAHHTECWSATQLCAATDCGSATSDPMA